VCEIGGAGGLYICRYISLRKINGAQKPKSSRGFVKDYTAYMNWRVLVLLLCPAIGRTQTASSPNSTSVLAPYQATALENALRIPNLTFSARHPSKVLVRPALMAPIVKNLGSVSETRGFARACVIPLLPVPLSPDTDLGIQGKLNPSADPMPRVKELPICGQNPKATR
jgi:hypothetical protein